MKSYETIIGLEVHVQLNTRSKAFCSDPVQFGATPNTLVSPISLAHPGTLPKINKEQVNKAIQFGLALDSSISLRTDFDRKNYFYPDLPKGYQITQDLHPICIGGSLMIRMKEAWKRIRIHHIHMEEDAGKSMHDQDENYSLVDLNRAGTPLLEIVTEPDLRSADEVDAFMSGIRQLVRYLDISDGNMQEGSLRCDCNVSIRPIGSNELNARCEIKNLNSMRFARQAVAFEVQRQTELVENGIEVQQQTLTFDPATRTTSPIRSKEDAIDYRYFPDPDLPPLKINPVQIEKLKENQVILPWEYHQTFTEWGLSFDDATILCEERETAAHFSLLANDYNYPGLMANCYIQKIRPWLSENKLGPEEFPILKKDLWEFLDLIQENRISNTAGFEKLLPELLNNPHKKPGQIAQEMDLFQKGDSDFLENLIKEVLNENPEKVKAYQNGKKGLKGFFMGELMKKSKGKANPQTSNALLEKMLDF
jgi:aspartyl-tRNA(Asn)/glutamyl-tRNA(Gln) amidotransferase subunit B